MKKIYFTALFLFLLAWACEKGPEPRDTVLGFVRALQSDEEIDFHSFLDLNELVYENADNLYVYDSTMSLQENLKQYTGLFGPQGKIRKLWTGKQIVVGESEMAGDTALVEVSFIDRDTRKQYYNKMGLRKTDSGWLIFAFKIL